MSFSTHFSYSLKDVEGDLEMVDEAIFEFFFFFPSLLIFPLTCFVYNSIYWPSFLLCAGGLSLCPRGLHGIDGLGQQLCIMLYTKVYFISYIQEGARVILENLVSMVDMLCVLFRFVFIFLLDEDSKVGS